MVSTSFSRWKSRLNITLLEYYSTGIFPYCYIALLEYFPTGILPYWNISLLEYYPQQKIKRLNSKWKVDFEKWETILGIIWKGGRVRKRHPRNRKQRVKRKVVCCWGNGAKRTPSSPLPRVKTSPFHFSSFSTSSSRGWRLCPSSTTPPTTFTQPPFPTPLLLTITILSPALFDSSSVYILVETSCIYVLKRENTEFMNFKLWYLKFNIRDVETYVGSSSANLNAWNIGFFFYFEKFNVPSESFVLKIRTNNCTFLFNI